MDNLSLRVYMFAANYISFCEATRLYYYLISQLCGRKGGGGQNYLSVDVSLGVYAKF